MFPGSLPTLGVRNGAPFFSVPARSFLWYPYSVPSEDEDEIFFLLFLLAFLLDDPDWSSRPSSESTSGRLRAAIPEAVSRSQNIAGLALHLRVPAIIR